MAASGGQALLLSTSDPSQHHRLAALVELGTQSVTIEACFADLVDRMPCEDPKRNSQLICKTLFLLFWVFFVFVFSRGCGVFFILWVFLCVCSQIGLVTVFMGLFLGFIFCFFGFGDWVWLLDLDLGFARDWFGCFLDLGRT